MSQTSVVTMKIAMLGSGWQKNRPQAVPRRLWHRRSSQAGRAEAQHFGHPADGDAERGGHADDHGLDAVKEEHVLRDVFKMRLQHEIDAGEAGEEEPRRTGPGLFSGAMRAMPRKYQSSMNQQPRNTGALKMKGNR